MDRQPGSLRSPAAVPSQEPQQIQKQVDEIQVQLEGGVDGCLLQHHLVAIEILVVGPDLLVVVSGEAQEHHNAHHADDPLQSGEIDEQGQQPRDHQEDQPWQTARTARTPQKTGRSAQR